MFELSQSNSFDRARFSPELRHIAQRQPEKDAQASLIEQVRRTNNGTVEYNNIRFGSRSEIAIARLLERYVTGFRIELGESYEVPVGVSHRGHPRTVDFQVGDILIEYHPPRMKASRGRPGDFQDWRELKHFEELLRKTDPSARDPIRELFRVRCLRNYEARRQKLIDQSSFHRGKELIVVGNALDFYDRVLTRIATKSLPPRNEFQELFNEELKVGNDVSRTKRKK